MELPDRLDYFEAEITGSEDHDSRDWFPVVICTVLGCPWFRDSTWDDLAEDSDVDWDQEHPAHG